MSIYIHTHTCIYIYREREREGWLFLLWRTSSGCHPGSARSSDFSQITKKQRKWGSIGVCEKTTLLWEPSPCSPAAETALQPLTRYSKSLLSPGYVVQRSVFLFTETGMRLCPCSFSIVTTLDAGGLDPDCLRFVRRGGVMLPEEEVYVMCVHVCSCVTSSYQ